MSAPKPFTRGLVVVAALGAQSRLPIVGESLRHFDPAQWDCLALAYAALPQPVPHVGSRCRLETRPGWGWASLLNLTTPAVVAPYSHVFVLLDDVMLPTATFNLSTLIRAMAQFNTSVISPAVAGTSRSSMSVMQRPQDGPPPGKRGRGWWIQPDAEPQCVRAAATIEAFATLFTVEAWHCYHSMFDDSVLHDATGAVGWGYDICFKPHCASSAGGARQGIAVGQMAVHIEGPLSELRSGEEAALFQLGRYRARVAKPGAPAEWAANASDQAAAARRVLVLLRRELLDMGNVIGSYGSEFQLVAEMLGTSPAARPTSRPGAARHRGGRRAAARPAPRPRAARHRGGRRAAARPTPRPRAARQRGARRAAGQGVDPVGLGQARGQVRLVLQAHARVPPRRAVHERARREAAGGAH
jgi:hypothetical protein